MKITEARLRKLISCIMSVRLNNTNKWMDYIVGEINAALADIGEKGRVNHNGDCIVFRSKEREVK